MTTALLIMTAFILVILLIFVVMILRLSALLKDNEARIINLSKAIDELPNVIAKVNNSITSLHNVSDKINKMDNLIVLLNSIYSKLNSINSIVNYNKKGVADVKKIASHTRSILLNVDDSPSIENKAVTEPKTGKMKRPNNTKSPD